MKQPDSWSKFNVGRSSDRLPALKEAEKTATQLARADFRAVGLTRLHPIGGQGSLSLLMKEGDYLKRFK